MSAISPYRIDAEAYISWPVPGARFRLCATSLDLLDPRTRTRKETE
jgi:hypothetical protein